MHVFKILAVAGLILAPITAAQAESRPVVTKLTKPQSRLILDFLKSEDESTPPPGIGFKIPAKTLSSNLVCRFHVGKMMCYETTELTCPRTIDVEYPDGTKGRMDVDCTGPDSQGNCECEFA